MESERLRYAPVEAFHLDAFHALVQDDHVRRYLLDGELHPPEWTRDRITDSRALFQQRGVGIWLVTERASGEVVGFCGFLEIASIHPEPQLIYALLEKFSGKGYASEMARAAITHARAQKGFATIHASADAVNAGSVRILRKLGFEQTEVQQGSFGDLLVFQLSPSG
jgi:[ribosomal protein S5]-alanine N-acetyltransferase